MNGKKMENRALYLLTRIADLTLNRYSSLEGGDVGGVLAKHNAFLRQIHRISLVSGLTAKWIYEYDPVRPKGKRLTVILSLENNSGLPKMLCKYVEASPLSPFFDLELIKEDDVPPLNFERVYKYRATLVKREKYASSDSAPDPFFYSVNEWEMNDDARLLNFFNLIQKVDRPCVYAVTVLAGDLTNLIDSPEVLGDIMKRLRAKLSLRVEKTSGGVAAPLRDENANYTLKRYESLVEEAAANPHFSVNIQAFSDDIGYADMLLSSAASEALDEGSHNAVWEEGEFNMTGIFSSRINHFFAPQPNNATPPPVLRFWPTLFLQKELSPFNVFPALYPGESIEIPKETAPNYEKKGLFLGEDKDGYEAYFPLKNLSKHAFIAGVPGSGKTNSMLHIVTELYDKFKIPFLVFEPAKTEYRALLNRPGLEKVTVFAPSAATKFLLHINPFQFPVGIVLAEHIRLLGEVFMGAFPLELPFPILLDKAIEAVYRDKKWTPYMKNKNLLEFPTMSELFFKLGEILDATEYESEVKSNMKSILEVRIGSLLAREMGDMFDVRESTIVPEDWLKRQIVIELEALGKDQANFTTLLVTNLIRETLRANRNAGNEFKDKPRHVILFEEAHNLIGPVAEIEKAEDATPKTSATAFIVKMLAEVRALKEAIIIADQLPTKMAPEVIKNTSLKIAHRITAQDDRELMGGAMSADGVQFERMASFTQGEALVIYEGLLKPFELQMNKWARDEQGRDMDEWYVSPGDNGMREAIMSNDRDKRCDLYKKDMETSWRIMEMKLNDSWKKTNEIFSKEIERIKKENKNGKLSEEEIFKLKSKPLNGLFDVLLRAKAYIYQNIYFSEDIREFTRDKYIEMDELLKTVFTSDFEINKAESLDMDLKTQFKNLDEDEIPKMANSEKGSE